ncbi:glycosyltransferase family 87 protein [Sphingomicrobium marinum]|uniref:glycosyltransferase family 87 protein n=1 Tax=Sphingomicrobium marinum TaxID=1227950 RepID=UPI00224046E4|nr:glycosyltransferase family 87 protein [Sphingomicrobium marinum]
MLRSLRSGNWLEVERTRRIATIMLALGVLWLALLWGTADGTIDRFGRPVGADFSQVYAAGQMVWAGNAPDVWNWTAHGLVQQALHGSTSVDLYGWHYPPPFLLIAAPLALLPYWAALIVWQAVTLGAFALLARAAIDRKDWWLWVIGAPVIFICIGHGHNGFLTAALFGGAMLLLEKRPWVAGLLIGALVYKPHFALLLPLLLLVMKAWRTIAGAAISSLGLIAITLMIWGWPVWQAFIDSLDLTRTVILEEGRTGFFKIMSAFAWVRMWGGSVPLAYAAQAVVTLIAIGTTLWLATKNRPDLTKAAAATAALLATPYLLDYDLVLLLVATFFLWRDAEAHGYLPWDRTLIAWSWAAPFFARVVALAALIPLGPISLMLTLWVAIRRLKASPSRHSHGASAP